MADLTITAANVVAGADAVKRQVKAGGTITAGQLVARDTTTGKYVVSDADSATASLREPVGVALHGASDNQPLMIQTAGLITIGGTLSMTTQVYIAGDTAGAIRPAADLNTGDLGFLVGIAISTTQMRLAFAKGGIVP